MKIEDVQIDVPLEQFNQRTDIINRYSSLLRCNIMFLTLEIFTGINNILIKSERILPQDLWKVVLNFGFLAYYLILVVGLSCLISNEKKFIQEQSKKDDASKDQERMKKRKQISITLILIKSVIEIFYFSELVKLEFNQSLSIQDQLVSVIQLTISILVNITSLQSDKAKCVCIIIALLYTEIRIFQIPASSNTAVAAISLIVISVFVVLEICANSAKYYRTFLRFENEQLQESEPQSNGVGGSNKQTFERLESNHSNYSNHLNHQQHMVSKQLNFSPKSPKEETEIPLNKKQMNLQKKSVIAGKRDETEIQEDFNVSETPHESLNDGNMYYIGKNNPTNYANFFKEKKITFKTSYINDKNINNHSIDEGVSIKEVKKAEFSQTSDLNEGEIIQKKQIKSQFSKTNREKAAHKDEVSDKFQLIDSVVKNMPLGVVLLKKVNKSERDFKVLYQNSYFNKQMQITTVNTVLSTLSKFTNLLLHTDWHTQENEKNKNDKASSIEKFNNPLETIGKKMIYNEIQQTMRVIDEMNSMPSSQMVSQKGSFKDTTPQIYSQQSGKVIVDETFEAISSIYLHKHNLQQEKQENNSPFPHRNRNVSMSIHQISVPILEQQEVVYSDCLTFYQQLSSFYQQLEKSLEKQTICKVYQMIAFKAENSQSNNIKSSIIIKSEDEEENYQEILKQSQGRTIFQISFVGHVYRGQPAVLLLFRDVTNFNQLSALQSYRTVCDNNNSMLSQVAHELRTPLNCILAMLQLSQQVSEPVYQKRTSLTSERSSNGKEGFVLGSSAPSSSKQKTNQEKGTSQLSRFLDPALQSALHLQALIQDLLDMAQVKAGKFSLHFAEFDLKELMQEVKDMMEFEANQKDLQLVCEIKENVPQKITSDKLRIKQILINLIGNAIKYSNIKGEITVYCEGIGNKIIKFSVRDQGYGIKQENLQFLGQAFGKITDKENTSINPYGVGLGLMISNLISQKLSQSAENPGLQVHSNFGTGSVFSFVVEDQDITLGEKQFILPLQLHSINEKDEVASENNSKEIRNSSAVSSNHSNRGINSGGLQTLSVINSGKNEALEPNKTEKQKVKILVVDDEQLNLLVIREIMEFYFSEQLTYELVECTDGISCIEVIKQANEQQSTFDIIFMDLTMPRKDGFATISEIKSFFLQINQSDKIPPIVICSGYEIGDKELDQHGIPRAIVKPINPDVVEEIFIHFKIL